MAGISEAGEEKAWEILSGRKPEEVSRASGADLGADGTYKIISYGMGFTVSVKERRIEGSTPECGALLGRLGEFFRLSLLWYLASAKDIPCTGRLVRLHDMPGGDAFTRGSHALPLEKLAKKYGNDKASFIRKGKDLGAYVLSSGDASLRLLPFPRIPVVLTLWLADEEFPARADLMFDSTCGLQIPTDIAWSIAMMTVLIML